MTVKTSLVASPEMMDLAERMMAEFDDLPAGSVLRSLSRAVVGARAWGCPEQYLASTAEATARCALTERRELRCRSRDLRPYAARPTHRARSTVRL